MVKLGTIEEHSLQDCSLTAEKRKKGLTGSLVLQDCCGMSRDCSDMADVGKRQMWSVGAVAVFANGCP